MQAVEKRRNRLEEAVKKQINKVNRALSVDTCCGDESRCLGGGMYLRERSSMIKECVRSKGRVCIFGVPLRKVSAD